MKKKPDILIVLSLLFGLGILVSTFVHGMSDTEQQLNQVANVTLDASLMSVGSDQRK